MKNKLRLSAMMLILATSITACSTVEKSKELSNIESREVAQNNKHDAKKSDKASAEPLETSNEVNIEVLRQALVEYKFSLKGVLFNMTEHVMISDILSLGYEFKDDDDYDITIETDSYSLTSCILESEDGSRFRVMPCNTSDADVAYKDAELYKIKVEYYNEDKYPGYNPSFYIEGAEAIQLGVTTLEEFDSWTSDMDNIDTYDGSGYNTRTVSTPSDKYYSNNTMKFTFSDGVLSAIEITYM